MRERQRGKDWRWSILRPVLIVGCSVGSAMNVIPALGVYAAMMRRSGKTVLDYPGGVGRVAQAVDADLLARAIAWSGEQEKAANEIFNVTNGDVFVWPNVWPAIADALGFAPGAHVPLVARPGDPAARGGVGGDPRAARAGVGHARGLRRPLLRVCRLHDGLRPHPAGAAGAGLDHQADAGGLHRGDGHRGDVRARRFAEMQAKKLLPLPLTSLPEKSPAARRGGGAPAAGRVALQVAKRQRRYRNTRTLRPAAALRGGGNRVTRWAAGRRHPSRSTAPPTQRGDSRRRYVAFSWPRRVWRLGNSLHKQDGPGARSEDRRHRARSTPPQAR